jgi:hypothetical protein
METVQILEVISNKQCGEELYQWKLCTETDHYIAQLLNESRSLEKSA